MIEYSCNWKYCLVYKPYQNMICFGFHRYCGECTDHSIAFLILIVPLLMDYLRQWCLRIIFLKRNAWC